LVVNVEQHDAKISTLLNGLRNWYTEWYQLEPGGKLPCPESGLMKALSTCGTADKGVQMFSRGVVRTGFVCEFKMCFDDVININQYG
jgi:hypothetical protein